MRKFNNLKIRTKLSIAFLTIVLIMMGMSAYAILQVDYVNKEYTDLIDATNADFAASDTAVRSFLLTRVEVRNMITYASRANVTAVEESYAKMREQNQALLDFMPVYKRMYENESVENQKKLNSTPAALEQEIVNYYANIDEVYQLAMKYQVNSANKLVDEGMSEASESITAHLNDILSVTMASAGVRSDALGSVTRNMIITLVIITLVALAVSIFVSVFVSSVIEKPIKQIGESARRVAAGDLSVNTATNARDEIGALSRDFAEVVSSFNMLSDQILRVDKELAQGDIEAVIDENNFEGDYRKLAVAVNGLKGGLVSEVLDMLGVVDAFAEGDFTKAVPVLPGKKVVLTNALNNLKTNLISVSKDITGLISGGRSGKLDAIIDSTAYKGNWMDISSGLNELFAAFVEPLSETIAVLGRMEKGDLRARVEGDYHGEFAVMKHAINSTLVSTQGYIKEISRVLDIMSHEDFNVEVDKDFIGDFAPIKSSLNKIVDSFNGVLKEINISAEQVSSGARLISESSMNLAQGAAEQSSSIEQLNETIGSINKQTAKNAEDAENANELARAAVESANQGNAEMKEMVGAMAEINESMNAIAKVIKTIEDIALQTNLLAINASVEAARAGEHGKGFGVVAGQVRDLATRSQSAVKESAGIIEASFAKAKQGTDIADRTALTLNGIVTHVNDITDLIGSVAKASGEQKQSIETISDGISRISQVTQMNTATSEEEAASSQELSSQAEIFKNMVSKFKLRSGSSFSREERAQSVYVTPKSDDQEIYHQPRQTITSKPTQTYEKPVASVTPRPAQTYEKPFSAVTPKPVSSVTPKPVSSITPKPAANITPKPVSSITPKPVSSITPKPVSSVTPKPVASITPKPVSSATPKPSSAVPAKPAAKTTTPPMKLSKPMKPGKFNEVPTFSDYNAPNYGKY